MLWLANVYFIFIFYAFPKLLPKEKLNFLYIKYSNTFQLYGLHSVQGGKKKKESHPKDIHKIM